MMDMTTPLQTRRLLLRPFSLDDAPQAFRIFSDPVVNTFLPWYPVETLAATQTFLKERWLPTQQPGACRYAICLAESGQLIGYIQISPGESHDLGYGLAREHWGKGYAAEAARALLPVARQMGLPFLTATHDRKNPASGRVMEKLGMTYRYSYEELCQPKNILVTFRMYQLDLSPGCPTYSGYWERYPQHFIEQRL